MSKKSSCATRLYVTAGGMATFSPIVAYLVYEQYPARAPEAWLLALFGFATGGLAGLIASRLSLWPATVLLALTLAVAIDGSSNIGAGWAFASTAGIALLLGRRLPIVQTVAAAAFVLTAVLIADKGPVETNQLSQSIATENSRHAPVVHIVLDEHIGTGALSYHGAKGKQVRSLIEKTLVRHGLNNHPFAYSELFETAASLATAFNPTLRGNPRKALEQMAGRRHLRRNDYFTSLVRLGYRFKILQSDYMDFCNAIMPAVRECITYPGNAARAFASLDTSVWERLLALAAHGAHRFDLYVRMREGLRGIERTPGDLLDALPTWDWNGDQTASLNTAEEWPLLLSLAEDLKYSEVLFAHLLLPHHPYVFDAKCSIRPALYRRLDMADPSLPGPAPHTESGRKKRTSLYLDQLSCLNRMLDQLLEALARSPGANEATVVIHADHGSRIVGLFPYHQFAKDLSETDLRDSYSVLFAWRKPGVNPGDLQCPRALAKLLADLQQGKTAQGPCDQSVKPVVMMEDVTTGRFVAHEAKLFDHSHR